VTVRSNLPEGGGVPAQTFQRLSTLVFCLSQLFAYVFLVCQHSVSTTTC